jgi:hypothetical protein
MPNSNSPTPAHGEQQPLTPDQIIAIWSKSIDTHVHFHEMSTKSRQLGLTFAAAALGLGLVLLGQGRAFSLPIGSWHLHGTVLLIIGAVFAVLAVRKLDLGVYHQMLRGAVAFTEDFESNCMNSLYGLEKGLTQAICHYSRHSDAASTDSPVKHYTGSDRVTAGAKIAAFYNTVVVMLVASALVLFVITNV